MLYERRIAGKTEEYSLVQGKDRIGELSLKLKTKTRFALCFLSFLLLLSDFLTLLPLFHTLLFLHLLLFFVPIFELLEKIYFPYSLDISAILLRFSL